MKTRMYTWTIAWLLSALIAVSCGPAGAQPNPAPTPAGNTTAWLDRSGARDAALAYIIAHYGDAAPAAGLTWLEERITPEKLLGGETYQYTSGDWIIVISYPIVLPDLTVYHVVVSNQASGFQWEGEVTAAGQVTEQIAPAAVRAARDAALAYIRGHSPQQAPPADLVWRSEYTTPTELVGRDDYRFTAAGWVVEVSYPVVAPEQVVYHVVVTNRASGFRWEGQVDARGQLTEQPAKAYP